MVRKRRARERGRFTTISIPTTLFNRIEEKIKGTGFPSVSSFATYVLREIVAEKKDWKEPLTKEEEEKIKERLRSLGYLE